MNFNTHALEKTFLHIFTWPTLMIAINFRWHTTSTVLNDPLPIFPSPPPFTLWLVPNHLPLYSHREPKRWSVLVLYIFLFIYFSVFILPFNWIITLNYTNMSYNNNTPIVEHIITTYKLICICMFFSLFI
jgi:hypothetical protein